MNDRREDEVEALGSADASGLAINRERRVRMVREPALTAKELVAFVLTLLMVCGPLAMGAFGL